MYNKLIPKESGIYQIVNIETGDFYIGSAYNLYNRVSAHRSLLSRNKHNNIHLQRAWNKYGEKSFEFKVLFLCNKSIVREQEQIILDYLNPAYNLSKKATGTSGIVTDKMKDVARKMGLAQKGKKKPKSYSDKLSKRMLGNKLGVGKTRSAEFKEKLKIRNIGNKYFAGKSHTKEWKNSMSEKLTGRVFSEETRRKMSVSAKLRKARELAEKEGRNLCLTN